MEGAAGATSEERGRKAIGGCGIGADMREGAVNLTERRLEMSH